MIIKFPLKKSFVGFLDILGFSERYPSEQKSCIKLISSFAEYNGEHFDNVHSYKREVRAATLSFSDNIAISIPVETDENSHTDEFHAPLFTFLHTISFFSYKALEKGFYIRGAIAYGEIYHNQSVIAGIPFIEAAKYEKIANYPRVILTPSALKIMQQLYQLHCYGWSSDKIRNNLGIVKDSVDDTTYFDWLNFFKNNSTEVKKLEIKNTIKTATTALSNAISSENKIEILKKLDWMKNYLENISCAYQPQETLFPSL